MSTQRPKPSFPKGPEPNKPWIEWIDRQIGDVLGSTYTSLAARFEAIAGQLTAGVSALVTAVAALDTRVDDLEAADESYKTSGYGQAYTSVGASAATTYYWRPFGDAGTVPGTVLATGQIIWGRAGTMKNLRFNNTNPTGDADTFTLTLNVNGSDTALTIANLSGSTSTIQSDTTHSVSVAVGDKVCFSQVNDGAHNVGSQPRLWFEFEGS